MPSKRERYKKARKEAKQLLKSGDNKLNGKSAEQLLQTYWVENKKNYRFSDQCPFHIFTFEDEQGNKKYYAYGRPLGAGFFGKAYQAYEVKVDAENNVTIDRNNPVVMKRVTNYGRKPFKRFINHTIGTERKFRQETKVLHDVMGHDIAIMTTAGKEFKGHKRSLMSIQPMQGEVDLSQLLKDTKLLQKVSFELWNSFFQQVLDQITKLHEAGYHHNDIKPDNIRLTLKMESDKVIGIEAFVIDYGNVRKHHQRDVIGDLNFQNTKEALDASLFNSKKANPAIDVNALGHTFGHVVRAIEQEAPTTYETKKSQFQECATLFKEMHNKKQKDRLNMYQVKDRLQDISAADNKIVVKDKILETIARINQQLSSGEMYKLRSAKRQHKTTILSRMQDIREKARKLDSSREKSLAEQLKDIKKDIDFILELQGSPLTSEQKSELNALIVEIQKELLNIFDHPEPSISHSPNQ